MKCRIDKGAEIVYAPNNKESILFNKIYSITNDFQEALDTYAVVETNAFEKYSSLVLDKGGYDINGEPDLKTFMNYINVQTPSKATKKDVMDMMEATGIFESEDLLRALSKIENEGIAIFSLTNLEDTGLFSTFEAGNIQEDIVIQDNIKEILKYLRQNEDFALEPKTYFKNDIQTNTGKRQAEVDLNEDSEVEVAPKRVQTKYTILKEHNAKLAKDISFLVTGVTESTWESSKDAIRYILKSIENSALSMGIDIRGISIEFMNKDREDVLDMLDATEAVLAEEITEDQFDEIREEFFSEGATEEYRIVKEGDIIIKENLTEDEAFEQGMLKVSDDVYRPVEILPLDEMIEIQASNEKISKEEMKEIVDKNYDRSLVNGREIFILKRNSNTNTKESSVNTTDLNALSADFDYLDNDFVRDFMKVADMQYFNIDFRGITFKQGVQKEIALSTLDAETLHNLEQYSLISPYLSMPYEVKGVTNMIENQLERAKHLANPNLAEKYHGEALNTGDVIAIRNKVNQFLNIRGELYELVNRDQNISFYKQVESLDKPIMESDYRDFTALRTTTKESKIKKTPEGKKMKDKHYNC